MPDSAAADTSHPGGEKPAASSLDIPGGAQLVDANSAVSGAIPAASQDPEQAYRQPDTGTEGGSLSAGETLPPDGVPGEGATADGGEGGENAQAKKKKSEPRIIVPFTSEELDEIIKQGFTIVEKECQKEEYDNGRVERWKTLLEDYLVKSANSLDKPFKYTFYVSVHQNSGDAMNMALGGFFQADFDGYTTGHWENDDVLVDVVIMAFSVQ